MNAAQTDTRRKRLLYQAQHRGFKEADLLIGGFAAARLAAMSDDEMDAFERLLAHSDHDIFAWATGAAPAPPEISSALIEAMRAFDVAAITAPR